MLNINPLEVETQRQVIEHKPKGWLLVLLVINCLSTFSHYTDNFIFFDKYPAPSWMVPHQVYTAWLILTPFAVMGYVLYANGKFLISYGCLGIYSITGISSFGHYFFGSLPTLSVKMNALICFDVISGLCLLSFIVWSGLIQKEWQDSLP